MATALNHCPAHGDRRESFWLLVRRFMAINQLSPIEFYRLFWRGGIVGSLNMSGTPAAPRFDTTRLIPLLGHDHQSIQRSFPYHYVMASDHSSNSFKFCEACAAVGYHSALYEQHWVRRCPIHGSELQTACRTCGKSAGSCQLQHFGKSPRTWPCGHPWTDADIRLPTGLELGSVVQLADWTEAVLNRTDSNSWFVVELAAPGAHSVPSDRTELIFSLLATATEMPDGLRLVLPNSRYRTPHVQRTDPSNVHRDWFKSILTEHDQLVEGGVSSENVYGQLYMMDWIKAVGEQSLSSQLANVAVCRTLDGNDQLRLFQNNPRLQSLLPFVFLHKYVASNLGSKLSRPARSYSELDWLLASLGRPLSLLRFENGEAVLYWAPLKWGQN